MTWRSTIKNKAREYIPRHYLLSSHQTPEENMTNANELIRGATFVRDGVDDDVCPDTTCNYRLILFAGYHKEHGIPGPCWPRY